MNNVYRLVRRGLSLPHRVLRNIQNKRYVSKEKKGNKGLLYCSHVTYYLDGNAGDTVLSQCVRRVFNIALHIDKWELISVVTPVSTDELSSINRTDVCIVGGGGLFLPDTNENTVSGWQWAISKEQLKSVECPILIFGVGYNYFKGQTASELFIDNLKCLLDKSSFVGLRNKGSIEAIRKIIPSSLHEKIVYQPCPTTLIRKIFNIPKKKKTNNIAVNIAFDRCDRRFGNRKESILRQIAKGIKAIQQLGYNIFYIAHISMDLEFIRYLDEVGCEYKTINLEHSFPAKVYHTYNLMDMVIGMRGHAQMIPFGLNCEIISLSTHDKMKWFLEDIDATDWLIDVQESDGNLGELLLSKFKKIHIEDSERTLRRLIEKQEYLWRITIENLNNIKELLKDDGKNI